jgi:hypothetical protein
LRGARQRHLDPRHAGQQKIKTICDGHQMPRLAQALRLLRSKLEQRVSRHLLNTGFLVDRFPRHFTQNFLHADLAAWIEPMIGRRD